MRSVIGPDGQKVSALDRLYLADQIPFLLIWGSDDPVIPVEHGRRAHELVAHSHYVEIEGSGHWPMLDQPDRIVRELTSFIEETEPFEWSLEAARERMRRGPGASRRAMGVRERVSQGIRDLVSRRIPGADLDDRDPDYIREQLPGLWVLASFYFRADVRGLERIPAEGPVLLVGNHSGGNVTPDTMVFTLAFYAHFGVERGVHPLVHNLVLAMPLPWSLAKFGCVAASPENARLALERDRVVLVYPGGDWEVHRPSWQENRVEFAGRKGWAKLAIETGVPIVPLVAVGGQETAIFLSRGERLAKVLQLDRLFRLKVLPISLSIPWGLNVGDMLGHWPLPAKLTVEAMEPIDVHDRFGRNPDVDEVYDYVTRVMQIKLDELSAERRLPLIG